MTTDEAVEPPPGTVHRETVQLEARRSVNPDRLAELEEERRFLLRSIADLERERVAGDVEDADYHALRDGYTARAATVLRAIDEGRSGLAPKRPRDWKRLAAVVLAIVVVGVGAGILVARASGQRDPGDTITGGTSPDQVATLLSEGRSLLAGQDYGEASKRFLSVLDIDADNVEALTYAGWVLAVSTGGQTDAAVTSTLLDQSQSFLDKAIATDPSYADPYCFTSIVDVLFRNDTAGGAEYRTKCLAADPPTDLRGLLTLYVDPVLDSLSGSGETDTSTDATTADTTAGSLATSGSADAPPASG